MGNWKALEQDCVAALRGGETCEEALPGSKVQDSVAQILHTERIPTQEFAPLSKASHPPNLPIKVHVHGTSQST